jgi:hypothetical protein
MVIAIDGVTIGDGRSRLDRLFWPLLVRWWEKRWRRN